MQAVYRSLLAGEQREGWDSAARSAVRRPGRDSLLPWEARMLVRPFFAPSSHWSASRVRAQRTNLSPVANRNGLEKSGDKSQHDVPDERQ
jgi:hypothetical protein